MPDKLFITPKTICIDIDDCIASDGKTISDGAKSLIAKFNSRTEFSQSGTGIHIYITADWNEIIQFYDMFEVPHEMNCFNGKTPCLTIHRNVDAAHITENPYNSITDVAERTDRLKAVLNKYTEYYKNHTDKIQTQTTSTHGKPNYQEVAQIAEYIRKNEHYCYSNKDSEERKSWYLCHDGSYEPAAVSEFKAMIKSHIEPGKRSLELINAVYEELLLEPIDSLRKIGNEQFNEEFSTIVFFNECCTTCENNSERISTSDMYDAYLKWYAGNADKLLKKESKVEFKRLLKAIGKGETVKVQGKHYYSDFTLKERNTKNA